MLNIVCIIKEEVCVLGCCKCVFIYLVMVDIIKVCYLEVNIFVKIV